MFGEVPVPLLLSITAVVILLVKRRRNPYRQLIPHFISLLAFAIGVLWVGSQGHSLINMIVTGASAAMLVGFGFTAYQRRSRSTGGAVTMRHPNR